MLGLLTAFVSNHYANRVMGDANLGVGIFAPAPESPEWRQKLELRTRADRFFYVGLALTAPGALRSTRGRRDGRKGPGVEASPAK